MNPSYRQDNRDAWNEATLLHLRSPDNPIGRILSGSSTLAQVEIDELGDIREQRLLHLMCNCGHDTLSLAKLGASCVGVDISDKAIETAKEAAATLALPVDFVRSDVYDLALSEQFDIVYVSKGSLYWLDDLAEFAKIVARHLRPSGRLYIYEDHSLLGILLEIDPTEYNRATGDIDYFHKLEPSSTVGLDYIGLTGQGTKSCHEWQWTMGDFVTSIAQAGLKIEFLHEWPFVSSFRYWDWLIPIDNNTTFKIPPDKPQLPLSFTLQAVRF